MLWLFVSAVAFGVGLANGLAILIIGGALIFGEVWIERSGERHATFATVWRLSWRIALGAALVVIAIVSSDGWGAALLIFFGAWLVLPAVLVATLWWRERREEVVRNVK
jgi:predicted MFS family arabinose efflux permease